MIQQAVSASAGAGKRSVEATHLFLFMLGQTYRIFAPAIVKKEQQYQQE
jgi:hypothetical protein